jgi:NAD(P)-dependent dehydrogenase (short-subunit alcohol dehydrogenase family)
LRDVVTTPVNRLPGAAMRNAVIKDNIRVDAICPGIIETSMIVDRVSGSTDEGQAEMIKQEPIGRMGKPEEIAQAVLYMCSKLTAFMVGHAMVVDGGQTVGLR